MAGETIFSVPAQVIRVTTNPYGGVRIAFDTQENLSSDVIGRLAQWHNKRIGHLLFLQEQEVEPETLLALPKIEKGKRSQAQKIRFLLHRIAVEEGVPEEKFEEFYTRETDKYMVMLEQRLEVPIEEYEEA